MPDNQRTDSELWQMHFQWIENGETVKTEFVAQHEAFTQEDLRAWQRKIMAECPLPEGAIWMWCPEGSKYFVYAAEESP